MTAKEKVIQFLADVGVLDDLPAEKRQSVYAMTEQQAETELQWLEAVQRQLNKLEYVDPAPESDRSGESPPATWNVAFDRMLARLQKTNV
jgi:hypothetical protein